MAYVLNDKIKITKPIIFLCGPFYHDSDKSDRRKILQNFLLKELCNPDIGIDQDEIKENSQRCLPLIIDDFLTKKNLDDDSISIQFLEEIFAGISYKTFIFLDTMSSAVELGLFANNACNNSIYVLIPHDKERNCGSIGMFVKEIVLEDNMHKIKTVYYHPQIERVAFSTDHVGEYYKFIRNELPEFVKKDILYDYKLNCKLEYEIKLENKDCYPQDDYCINYQYNNQKAMDVFISVKLLFYIISGIIYSEYSENIKTEDYEFDSRNIKNIVAHLKSVILMFLLKKTFSGINSKTEVNIYTVLSRDIEEIVKHIVAFIFTYHKNARLRGYYFVCKDEVVKDLDIEMSPTDFFGLDTEDTKFITRYNSTGVDCFRSFKIESGQRKREIITYQENTDGKMMRKLHEKLAEVLQKTYIFDEHSYAYQKGKSVKMCVEEHKQGNSFLKYDIHKFFNSISKKRLAVKLMKEFEIDKIYEDQIIRILNTCFKDDKMPIGLITSPILSDLYMKKFDEEFVRELGNKYVYTRYADDILISSPNSIDDTEKIRINNLLRSMLRKLGMTINGKKSVERDLRIQGQHVKYLGINIVKSANENVISVGKTYKNYIAKCYLKYVSMADNNDLPEKFYFGKQIAGYLSFVNMIEGQSGLKKIYTRIEKSTEGRVVIQGNIDKL